MRTNRKIWFGPADTPGTSFGFARRLGASWTLGRPSSPGLGTRLEECRDSRKKQTKKKKEEERGRKKKKKEK